MASMNMNSKRLIPWIKLGISLFAFAFVAFQSSDAAAGNNKFRFDLVRSPALNSVPDCVPNASGEAKIQSIGPVENLNVKVNGLPPNTDFDFFVIQQPNGPFGMSWYQGDIETDENGE